MNRLVKSYETYFTSGLNAVIKIKKYISAEVLRSSVGIVV